MSDKTTSDKTKWKPSEEQRSVLEKLVAEQAKEESAAAFTRKFLNFGASKWSKILDVLDPDQAESYFDQVNNPDQVMANLEVTLSSITRERSMEAIRSTIKIHELAHLKAVAQAVDECNSKEGPERLVKFLAPTGGGKSMVCAMLRQKYNARVVEVREGWRRSYSVVLRDISAAVGLRAVDGNDPIKMENDLIDRLLSRKVLLALDEAEFFGVSALNGLKLLLNRTRVVLVICAMPTAHDRWNTWFRHEAEQIRRRTHAVIEVSALGPEDVQPFFPANQFADRPAALAAICTEASNFGHFSFVDRVAGELRGEKAAKKADVEAALKAARKQMGLR